MFWKNASLRVTRHELIVHESQLVEWTEVEAGSHDFGVGSFEGLGDVFDDYSLGEGENDVVGVEPFEVLDRLVSILEQVLSHIGLHGVPHLEVSDTIFRLHD